MKKADFQAGLYFLKIFKGKNCRSVSYFLFFSMIFRVLKTTI